MIKKSTWIVLGILILVLATFILIDKRSEKPEDIPEPTQPPTLRSLSDHDLKSITYEEEAIEPIQLEKVAELEWAVTSHSEGKITPGEMEMLLSYLSNLQVITEMTNAPPDEEIGLDFPQKIFTFIMEDGTKYTIEIGSLTPLNTSYYSRIDGDEVFVIPASSIDQASNLMTNAAKPPTPTPDLTATNDANLNEIETPTPTKESEGH